MTKLLGHGLDLGLLAIIFSLVLLMPVMPGGWEATVDEEERHRVLAGTVVEEKEDMAENYNVSLPSPMQTWIKLTPTALQRLLLCSLSAVSYDARGLHFFGVYPQLPLDGRHTRPRPPPPTTPIGSLEAEMYQRHPDALQQV